MFLKSSFVSIVSPDILNTLYILGMNSFIVWTASGITSFICCAMKPYILLFPFAITSIYLYVLGWIAKIFCNAESSLISSISFLIRSSDTPATQREVNIVPTA